MKNKILTITIIFILLSFIFINSVSFCVNYESEHYVEIETILGNVFRFCANEPFYCIPENVDGTEYWTPYSFSTNERIYVSVYRNGVDYYGKEVSSQFHINNFNKGEHTVINSKGTVVLYKDSTKTDYFFQSPPVEEITLAGIMNKAGEQATVEMEKIILIVIVTTAGLTVLLIGLKKGLTVLMNGLRH